MRPVIELVLPWEPQGVTIIGDPHTFKTEALTDLQRSDLQEAKDKGDLIVLWGDVTEWIVSSDLKRYNAKHNSEVDGYVNKMVRTLADFYEPFVNNIALMKLGNHETAFIKYHHVDPMALLIAELNRRRDQALEPIRYGGYTCWWIVKFIHKTANGDRNGSGSVKFWLHHGAGGAAPVTKGAIDRARIQDGIVGADVYVVGHHHTAVSIPTLKETCDDYGNVRRDIVDFIVVPGYSGWEQDAPGLDGYTLDWPSENFYNLEMTGSVRIMLEPRNTSKDGRNRMYIKRTVETTN